MAPGNALTPQLMAARPLTAHPHRHPDAPPAPRHRPAAPHPHAADAPDAPDLRRFAFELPAQARAVGRARRLVAERLALWGLAGQVGETAELVVSELFTNAVVHTGSGRVVCELRDRGAHVRIAVHDEGCAGTRPRPTDREECGRGLILVDAVSSAWGSHGTRHGAGRVVWAELLHDTADPC
ncbi:ATP-binding protein [Streptomyces sp. DH12]|uniref:ATP-binding protein n=1 Tax=Streptomyces sp. DH12 TaxID=2857010 RepID=UPI001E576C9A|nr:ATP-binding protein [Streptomyces sp. DH12]